MPNKPEFFFYLADIYTIAVQYGDRTGLCELLYANSGFDMNTQMEVMYNYGNQQGVHFSDYDAEVLAITDMNTVNTIRQWTYQYCTEFGFFQIPNLSLPLRSDYINSAFWPDYCDRIYGTDRPLIHVPDTNSYYGGLEITGDNIVFVNSIEDPW